MAMNVDFILFPYGNRNAPTDLGHIAINTSSYSDDYRHHQFKVYDNKGSLLLEGQIDKTKSGHRNFLHLLKDILNSVDLSVLGENYVTTEWDTPVPNNSDKRVKVSGPVAQ